MLLKSLSLVPDASLVSINEEFVATIVHLRAFFLSEGRDEECFRIFPTEILVCRPHLHTKDQLQ